MIPADFQTIALAIAATRKESGNNLLRDIKAAPPGSIHWRNIGSGKVEILSIVKGSVTRLGTTKDKRLIALAARLNERAC